MGQWTAVDAPHPKMHPPPLPRQTYTPFINPCRRQWHGTRLCGTTPPPPPPAKTPEVMAPAGAAPHQPSPSAGPFPRGPRTALGRWGVWHDARVGCSVCGWRRQLADRHLRCPALPFPRMKVHQAAVLVRRFCFAAQHRMHTDGRWVGGFKWSGLHCPHWAPAAPAPRLSSPSVHRVSVPRFSRRHWIVHPVPGSTLFSGPLDSRGLCAHPGQRSLPP